MTRWTILLLPAVMMAADVEIRFKAVVGQQELACGKSYGGVGTSKSTVTPRDFRFYVHNVRVVNRAGKEVPVTLKQDEKWQLDEVALLDFENGTGACSNGTAELNMKVLGTVPDGEYAGLRFRIGVPFEKNHTDPTATPSPLNLTALSWVWNAGRKFARLDFSSTGAPRGYAVHLGSTGCTPNEARTVAPEKCLQPNVVDVRLDGFDVSRDVAVADLAVLLQDSDVDSTAKGMAGCMSGPDTPACKPLFLHLGLPIGDQEVRKQDFIRSEKSR